MDKIVRTMQQVDTWNMMGQMMLLAMMVGMAEGMEGPKYAPPAVGSDSKIPLTSRKKESKISGNETIKRRSGEDSNGEVVEGLTPSLRRQGERYIRRWTEAMFTTKAEQVSDN